MPVLKIKQMRLSKGMTQEQLSEVANVDRAYLSCLENGKTNPTQVYLEKIAVALGCRVIDFY